MITQNFVSSAFLSNINIHNLETLSLIENKLFKNIQESTNFLQDLAEDTYQDLIAREKIIQRKALLNSIFPNFKKYLVEKKDLSFEKKQQITAINELIEIVAYDDLKYTVENRTKKCSETDFINYSLIEISQLVQNHIAEKTLSPFRSSHLLKNVISPAIESLNEIDQNGKTLQDKFDDINKFAPPLPRILVQLHSVIRVIRATENNSRISSYDTICILQSLNTYSKNIDILARTLQSKLDQAKANQKLNSEDLNRISALQTNKEFLKNIKTAVKKVQSNLRQYKLNSIKILQETARLEALDIKTKVEAQTALPMRDRANSAPALLEITQEHIQSAYVCAHVTLDEIIKEMQSFYKQHFEKFGIFNPLVRLLSSSFRNDRKELSTRLNKIKDLQKEIKKHPELYTQSTAPACESLKELTAKIQQAIQKDISLQDQSLSTAKKTHRFSFCPSSKNVFAFQEKLQNLAAQSIHDKSDAAIVTTLLQEKDYISAANVLRQLEEKEKENLHTPPPCDVKRPRSQSLSTDTLEYAVKRPRSQSLSTSLVLTRRYSASDLIDDSNRIQLSKEDVKASLKQTADSLTHLVNCKKLDTHTLKNKLKAAQKNKETYLEATSLWRALAQQGLFGSLAYKKRSTASIFKLVASAPDRTLTA